jgi:hypothetical protein
MKDSWLTPVFSFHRGRVAIAALLFCLTLSGCGVTSSVPKPEGADDFALTAEELESAFRQDEKATARRYQGKTIELCGVVQSMYGYEPSFIGLYRGSGLLGLPCEMKEKEPWTRVSFGQQVTVRGRWPEECDHPSLSQCVIVETGPNRTVRLAAVQLASEYAADPQGTKKKYAGKPLILSGEVVEDSGYQLPENQEEADDDSSQLVLRSFVEIVASMGAGGLCSPVYLKVTDKVHINFRLRSAYKKRRAAMTAGKQVTIFAEAAELSFFKNEIVLEAIRKVVGQAASLSSGSKNPRESVKADRLAACPTTFRIASYSKRCRSRNDLAVHGFADDGGAKRVRCCWTILSSICRS